MIHQDRDRNTLTTTKARSIESGFLIDAEILTFAQFVKRMGWFEFASNAASDDEAYLIKEVFDKLQEILTQSGCV